nr:immunoglobulin light chain junction region [Macaca mulatta]MPO03994.1 immunoglobulin light chain junction region [Macaca mulatta]MPO04520.1 immunoglobulin light chain junction region [Macaca mulatta]MPO05251.1 immunoglobulin light chain junction region [Macaca mulatta]MPO05922.1 immunoglobulin light chain junction region [Macaca mulatta]
CSAWDNTLSAVLF